uniref:Uncharacterized protein n=1 Tax=Ascaris lumbricoides TaxID=6252 RepID=A0A0M3I885_ASCLU
MYYVETTLSMYYALHYLKSAHSPSHGPQTWSSDFVCNVATLSPQFSRVPLETVCLRFPVQ